MTQRLSGQVILRKELYLFILVNQSLIKKVDGLTYKPGTQFIFDESEASDLVLQITSLRITDDGQSRVPLHISRIIHTRFYPSDHYQELSKLLLRIIKDCLWDLEVYNMERWLKIGGTRIVPEDKGVLNGHLY